jgi:Xaa-Pro aminopeptidase
MHQSPMLEFPLSEYEQRLAGLRKRMAAEGIDAVILTSEENTRYFCGFRMITWDSKISKPGTLVVTMEGEPVLVGARSGANTMAATSCLQDIRTFDPSGRDGLPELFPDAIAAVLADKKLLGGRIGMELGTGFRLHLSYEDTRRLMELLLSARLVDAGKIIWSLRAVKSPLEIERAREACSINVKAFEKAFLSVKEGMTERELLRLISAEMFALGADKVFSLGLRAGPERYGHSNCPPGDRPIGRGELILIDGGPGYRGYFSDIIREAVIGEPNQRQRDLFAACVEACMTGVEMVRPGVTPAEITQAVRDCAQAGSFADQYISHGGVGHAIGLDVHELPLIHAGDNTPLEAGMVLAIEPSFYEEGQGMFNIEENLLVTETGYEILTPLKHDLWVL